MQPETPGFQPNEFQQREQSYRTPQQDEAAFRQKVRLLIILAVGVVLFVTAVIIYNVFASKQFRVVSTNPAANKVATVTPFFKVTFNKQLSKDGLSVSSNPVIVSSYSVSGDILDINLNPPLDNTKTYTITINSITDSAGKTLTDKQFSFQPQQMTSDQLPQDQQQALLRNQANYQQQRNDPILAYLPYTTLDFSLNYSYVTQNNKPKLELQAQLQLAPGLSAAEAASTTNQYKQEVLDFIKSKGLNPANYTIQYQVVQESLTGA